MEFVHSSKVLYRAAQASDQAMLITLLQNSKLAVLDVDFSHQSFVVACLNGRIVGCAAVEIYGRYGLLRSVAVENDYRNMKIGERLIGQIEEYAQTRSIHTLYLLTTTANRYFKQRGWIETPRQDVPVAVVMSSEFASVCPTSAICFSKHIK